MKFESRLKGYVAETLIESVLADAGYKVVRVGLEKRVTGHPLLAGFAAVPPAIRSMPDFMVMDSAAPVLVEVKYRADWTAARGEIAEKVATQLRLFPDLRVVMCCGGSGRFTFARNHLRVIRPVLVKGVCHHAGHKHRGPVAATPWDRLYSLATEFPRLQERTAEGTLQTVARLLFDIERSLARSKLSDKWPG